MSDCCVSPISVAVHQENAARSKAEVQAAHTAVSLSSENTVPMTSAQLDQEDAYQQKDIECKILAATEQHLRTQNESIQTQVRIAL